MPENIYLDSMNKFELENFVISQGMQKFRAIQIHKWVYRRGAESVAEMTDLSIADREKLLGMAKFTVMNVADVRKSAMDGSVKFLFSLEDGETIEAVVLNDGRRLTACISSQVGCRMGCAFCSTAKMGLRRNLTMGEIIKQVKRLNEYLASEGTKLNNLVFMGMGEPLDNLDNVKNAINVLLDDDGYGFSHKKITLSTCGLTDRLEELFAMDTPVNLAVSVNAADQETRKGLMPVSNKYPLSGLMDVLKKLPLQKRKSITIEYVLLRGVNDTLDDARKLAKLLRGLDKVKINLITYNSGGDAGYLPPSEKDTLKFQEYLISNKIGVFIRKSLGRDIEGACGQLRAKHDESQKSEDCSE
ncbi:radical SAM enzyme, Cfr family [Denitrovibrio acetiphilus DSM 12809]|uniref:Probable dual-specificity RNA methyltransferase RlmN n=1 Tax=Denitrovibrio acetiphilus (strain DSM 12809 / NBRC 114555 / N2460) TaxID=522772 RepID=D4H104_DENA2|nr:23S rRNA (adenine(2503)-C(2))-methyltransferase RlmN [Denitrovibrio acetiphilus]ADD68667.1 radical SAM enzyme, Cfr family [Denitrovibrio acetiphilus DSM 12809]